MTLTRAVLLCMALLALVSGAILEALGIVLLVAILFVARPTYRVREHDTLWWEDEL